MLLPERGSASLQQALEARETYNRNWFLVVAMTDLGNCESGGIRVGWFDKMWAARADPSCRRGLSISSCSLKGRPMTYRVSNEVNPALPVEARIASAPLTIRSIRLVAHGFNHGLTVVGHEKRDVE